MSTGGIGWIWDGWLGFVLSHLAQKQDVVPRGRLVGHPAVQSGMVFPIAQAVTQNLMRRPIWIWRSR